MDLTRPPPTVAERISALPVRTRQPPLPLPLLGKPRGEARIFLGIESFRRHMSNEGWQLQAGLSMAGYQLWGAGLPYDSINVPQILQATQPRVAILQDKREWDPTNPACIAKNEAFQDYNVLGQHQHCLKLTVLKDAQHNQLDSVRLARQIGIHGWITYYHPDMVEHLTGYVRKDCLVRTYHGLDPEKVPPFADRARTCLLSGAASTTYYPMRSRLFQARLAHIEKLIHPGYHAGGTHTDEFLKTLSLYKVAICTGSIFGYALRKFPEATACGCRIITDLPPDEVLPGIDDNLVRIHPDTPAHEVDVLAYRMAVEWDPARQEELAKIALREYDYRHLTRKLATDIDQLHQRLTGH